MSFLVRLYLNQILTWIFHWKIDSKFYILREHFTEIWLALVSMKREKQSLYITAFFNIFWTFWFHNLFQCLQYSRYFIKISSIWEHLNNITNTEETDLFINLSKLEKCKMLKPCCQATPRWDLCQSRSLSHVKCLNVLSWISVSR